jgi:chromosome segregation protein
MGMLNLESSAKSNSEKSETSIINLWLGGGLIVAVLGHAVLSGMLIFKMEGFEGTKRQAQESETALAKARTELSSLQVEIESLKKQREILVPTIADWEKRLSDKAEAQAALTASEGKRRQSEADVAQAVKRLEDINKDLVSAEKQRAELISGIEKLKAEHLSLTKANTAAKVTLDQATESERRLNEAQNGLTSLNTRRKQLEAEIADVQKRLDQLNGEADESRKGREKLAAEAAMLRQQVQTLKDEKTDLEQRISALKAIQTTVQQEEQKLEQIRKEVTEWELRRDTAKAGLQKIDSDLSDARKLLQGASAKRDALVRESSGLESTIGGLKSEGGQLEKRLEQIRTEVGELERRRNAVTAESQQADSDLSAGRKLLSEMSAKQGELVRENSRLESMIERLKKEKEALEKDLGRMEGQQPKSLTGGQ